MQQFKQDKGDDSSRVPIRAVRRSRMQSDVKVVVAVFTIGVCKCTRWLGGLFLKTSLKTDEEDDLTINVSP